MRRRRITIVAAMGTGWRQTDLRAVFVREMGIARISLGLDNGQQRDRRSGGRRAWVVLDSPRSSPWWRQLGGVSN